MGSRFNPGGDSILQGLSIAGQNIGNSIARNKQEGVLQGLISRVDQGDESAMLELAQADPRIASVVDQMVTKGNQELVQKLGPIALEAQKMGDPNQIRAFLRAQAEGAPKRVQKELLETINMDDEQLINDINIAAQGYTGFMQPKDQRTTQIKNFEFGKQNPEFFEREERLRSAGATKVENNFNPETGKQDPTKSVKTQEQKAIISAEKALSDLDKVADTHSDEFLTTFGRIKASIGSALDKMDVDAGGLADFNAKRTKFANAAKQLFNNYRREITGAAASEKEMKDLLESMLNEGQGPRAFRASFDLFMEKARDNLLLARENAREGVNVGATVDNAPTLDNEPLNDVDLLNKYGIE